MSVLKGEGRRCVCDDDVDVESTREGQKTGKCRKETMYFYTISHCVNSLNSYFLFLTSKSRPY